MVLPRDLFICARRSSWLARNALARHSLAACLPRSPVGLGAQLLRHARVTVGTRWRRGADAARRIGIADAREKRAQKRVSEACGRASERRMCRCGFSRKYIFAHSLRAHQVANTLIT
jgi:hypothetical protein